MRYIISKKSHLDQLARRAVISFGKCQNPQCFRRVSEYNLLVWSHIIPRTCLHLRWLVDNALCLCLECEKYFTSHPLEQRQMFISVIGEDKFWELKKRQNSKEFIDYGKIAYDLKKYIHNNT